MSSDYSEGLKEALEYAGKLEAAGTAGEPIDIGGAPRLIRFLTPDGYKAEMLDLERYESGPRRKSGTATLRDLASFIEYLKNHGSIGGTTVYREDRRFTAILNGHGILTDEAGWGDHRAVFEPKWTPGWTAWEAFNNGWHTQDDFAQFLTDRIPEIAHPPAGEIVEAVENLRLHWNATYERVIQPSNDFVQLKYVEEAQAGTIRVPAKFTIVVTPFEGADEVTLDVALRFAKPDAQGKVKFQFRLEEKASQVVDEQFVQMQQAIAEETSFSVLWGSFAAKNAS